MQMTICSWCYGHKGP